MKFYYFTVILFLLFACGTDQPPNSVMLFNDIAFELREGEQVQALNRVSQSRYADFIESYPVQIPLYKHIEHNTYLIFIGIPYKASLAELIPLRLYGPDSTSVNFQTDSSTFIFRTYRFSEQYVSEYIRNESGSLIYVLCLNDSKQYPDSLFGKEAWANRFAENSK